LFYQHITVKHRNITFELSLAKRRIQGFITTPAQMKHRLRWTRWIALSICVSVPHFLPTSTLQWVGALMCLAVGARADFLALHGD
jgi:hypothetical protein